MIDDTKESVKSEMISVYNQYSIQSISYSEFRIRINALNKISNMFEKSAMSKVTKSDRNDISDFLEESNFSGALELKAIYLEYVDYCIKIGIDPLTKIEFSKCISECGYKKFRSTKKHNPGATCFNFVENMQLNHPTATRE